MSAAEDIVAVCEGRLAGTREEGVRAFHGVPYAAPPTGALRFHRPQPPLAWPGVREATHSRAASVQPNKANGALVQALTREMDSGVPGIMAWPGYAGDTYGQDVVDEDCLYLDIWVPDAKPGERLPVYLYYHGGANAMSSGHMRWERGANFAREARAIVVRPTYRLGALGWVHFGLVADALKEAVNLGLHDQFAALRWVHENIAAFGGDPENITIGGESCGASAVSHLLINRDALPLFRRAVLQSLSPFHNWCTQERQDAEAVARLYLRLLRLDDPRALLDIEPERLLAAGNILTRLFEADKNCAWRPLGAVVDGGIVPELPAVALSERPFDKRDFALMIGVAKDEWQFFRGHSDAARYGSPNAVRAVLAQAFGEAGARAVYDGYARLYPDHPPGHLLGDVMSFAFFKFSSLAIARNLARQGVPVHAFQFAYDLPGYGGYLRAAHTGDMPFVWRNTSDDDLRHWPGFDGADYDEVRRLAAQFGRLYADFVRCGDPGPAWPAFESGQETVMWFGSKIEARPHLLSAEQHLFAEYFPDVRALEDRLAGNTRAALGQAPLRAREVA